MDQHPFRMWLTEAETGGVTVIGWEVRDHTAIEAMTVRLKEAGIDVTVGTEEECQDRQVARMVHFTGPLGIRTELFCGRRLAPSQFVSPLGVDFVTGEQGLGHVVMRTPHVQEAVDFYCDVLGFRLSDTADYPWFFLGDAAHMTPPFLAQGMCQGIRDASGLVWKLAAHLRGGAGDHLLDTYQQEREPHVVQVTAAAKEFGRIICERDELAAARRDAELLAELAASARGTIRQSLIPGLSGGFVAPERFPVRGHILPQPQVTDSAGRSALLDEFTGTTFRLVLTDEADDSAVAAALSKHRAEGGFPVQLVHLHQGATPARQGAYREKTNVLSAWLSEHSCEAVLARPDHYTFGGVHDAADLDGLLTAAWQRWTRVAAVG
ncbi:FAD-dependent monooxygenase [Streptomyces sp. NPDC014892]|uniref:FAD-dependent monooxygenase n=1 Tax=Streptomyces sp. NPDC014892 TaxID=3364930 RepID=UPI0036FED2CA